jgi:hypothetical protein
MFAVASCRFRYFRKTLRLGRGLPGARSKHNAQQTNNRTTSRRLFSHLFQQAPVFFCLTRRIAARIPTIPYSTRRARARLRPQAVAVAMVAN